MHFNNKIHCLIIEDEPLAREILKQHIAGVEALELAGTCSNAVEAVSFLKEHVVDLLLLDIQMPQLLGTNFIGTLKNPPKVIFTTAFRKYAVEGFELDAVDYLLKPISFERFLKAVNKVLQLNISTARPTLPIPTPIEKQNGQSNSFMYFRAERKMVKVFFRDILFIEGLKDYISIFTTAERIITLQGMKKMEDTLPEKHFVRVHKSYIVALNKIDSIERSRIRIGDKIIPVGDTYRDDFFKIIDGKNV